MRGVQRTKPEMIRMLCATDLLPKSESALDRAGLLADAGKASLSILHVVDASNSGSSVEQVLHSAMVKMKARSRPPLWQGTVLPNVMVRAGNAARVIVDNLEQQKIELLVMGPHRPRGMRDTLEGTVAARLVSARKCPVLIVREAPRAAYRSVLLALDLSRVSAEAVRAAERLAIDPSTEVVVVHAFEVPYEGVLRNGGVSIDAVGAFREARKREAGMAVRNFLESQGADSDLYNVVIEEGNAASAINSAVERVRPDLLVMGTRGYGRARRALLGSVANRVMHQAKCDVLIVPEGSVRSSAQLGLPPPPNHGANREQVRNSGRPS
jgi:universal stress protein E